MTDEDGPRRWRDIDRSIVGHDDLSGLYRVTNLGEVISMPRLITRPGARPFMSKVKLMTPRVGNKIGHLHVCLTDRNGYSKNYWLHRLVAAAFCERKPGCDYVLHGRNGPTDNRASQLRWGTPTQNNEDQWDHGTRRTYDPPVVCKFGHELTDENAYIPPMRPNYRVCRKCQADRMRQRRRKRVG